MTPIDLFRILVLAFLLGSGDDGRVGIDAPPAQAAVLWIAHSETHRAAVWITPAGITYGEEVGGENP